MSERTERTMSAAERSAERIRITSPHTGARRSRPVVVAREIDAQTHLGEVYMRSLMRSQLRLAVAALTVVGLFVAGLPLAFHSVPALAEARIVDIPVPWILLGVAVYPAFVLIGWIYVRHAEHNEARFAELAAEPADTVEASWSSGAGRPRADERRPRPVR